MAERGLFGRKQKSSTTTIQMVVPGIPLQTHHINLSSITLK
jgi:hypothetical protein